MLAPSFDILEDMDVYSDSRSAKARSSSKKGGLGVRATSNANIKVFGGPQKASGLQQPSKSSKKLQRKKSLAGRQKSFGASSASSSSSSNKSRAFGAVLATPNTNNAKSQLQQGAKNVSVTFTKAGPTPMRAKSARRKTVTSIEVCHRGSGSYMPVDLETRELMRTNENAQAMYNNARYGSIIGHSTKVARSSLTAPIDDDAAFGIFEDDSMGGTSKQAGSDFLELEGMDLW